MTVGLAVSGFALCSIFMRPVAGWLLDNKSRSGLLKFSMIGLVIISLLFLIAPVLSLAIALRMISGFMFSGASTATNTNACDIIPKSRFSEGMAFLGLGNTLGSALGPVLGLLIMARYGFNAAFVVTALLVLAAAGITQGLGYKKIQRRLYLPGINQLKLSELFNASALPASVLALYATAGFSGVSAFIALHGQLSGIGSGGFFFMLLALGTGSTRLFSGRLADLKGERPMVLVGNSCFLLGFILLLFENSISYYLSGLFFGLGAGLFYPAMHAMAIRTVPPEKRGAASSTFLCSSDIGTGLGALVAGALVTLLGYRPMFGIMTIFAIASVFTYTLWASKTPSAFKNYKRDHKDGSPS
jgi:MFS family permease